MRLALRDDPADEINVYLLLCSSLGHDDDNSIDLNFTRGLHGKHVRSAGDADSPVFPGKFAVT